MPFPIWKLCSASFIAPPAIETSKAKALLSSYVDPPWSWKRRKVAAEPLVFAIIMRPISVLSDAVYKVALLVSDARGGMTDYKFFKIDPDMFYLMDEEYYKEEAA